MMLCSRRGLCVVILASLAVIAARETHVAAAPQTKPGKSVVLDPTVELERISVWHDQCRAGTFDILKVRGNDLPSQPEVAISAACVSLAAPPSSPRGKSGNVFVDKQSRLTANFVLGIQRAMSGGEGEDLCRLFMGSSDSLLSAMDLRRCQLFFSVLRKKQDSGSLCKQARAMGIADKNLCGNSFTRFLDGRPSRCEEGPQLLQCQELSGLVTALRSKEPKDCAASPFCKVLLSRNVRECEPYLKRANKVFCDQLTLRVAQLKRAEQEREQILHQEELRQVEAARKAQEEVARKALEQERQKQRAFKKGEPMHATSPELEKRMKAIEEAGRTRKQP